MMRISPRNLLIGVSVPVIVLFLFWLLPYYLFDYSADWSDIKYKLSESEVVQANVGKVRSIDREIAGFSWGFGSDANSKVEVTVVVDGSKARSTFRVVGVKQNHQWTLHVALVSG